MPLVLPRWCPHRPRGLGRGQSELPAHGRGPHGTPGQRLRRSCATTAGGGPLRASPGRAPGPRRRSESECTPTHQHGDEQAGSAHCAGRGRQYPLPLRWVSSRADRGCARARSLTRAFRLRILPICPSQWGTHWQSAWCGKHWTVRVRNTAGVFERLDRFQLRLALCVSRQLPWAAGSRNRRTSAMRAASRGTRQPPSGCELLLYYPHLGVSYYPHVERCGHLLRKPFICCH